MAIRFQCPSCQVIRSANPRLLGREIKCPECGQPVQLPTQEQIDEAKREKKRVEQRELAQQRALTQILAQASAEQSFAQQDFADRDFANWDNNEYSAEEDARMAAEERAIAANSANFTWPKPASGEDMDMTPMVDVTFLLLIFFMITASFSVQKSIQRPAQKNEDPSTQALETPPDDNPDIVTVQVDEFNAYNIITTDWDRAAGSKQDLIIALNDAHAGGSSGKQPSKLVVQAHEDCIHASVIAALDAGREAQFENFEVSTVEQFD